MNRRSSTRLLGVARLVENLADLYPSTVEHLNRQLASIDSYPKRVPGAGPATGGAPVNVCVCNGAGCDTCTPVQLTATEAGAESRLRHSLILTDLDAAIRLLEVTVRDAIDSCQEELRSQSVSQAASKDAKVCDCAGKEGALDEDGWGDPACREMATKAGLCGRHYHARRRWQIRNGRPTRDEEAA